MRSTFSILFYINRGKTRSDGTTSVLCRITVDGKSTVMTTGIYCKPSNWNPKAGETKCVRDNARLAAMRGDIEKAYMDILKKQGVVSAELLKNSVAGSVTVPSGLLGVGEAERLRLKARSEETGSNSTYRESGYNQRYLAEYLTSTGKSDIPVADVTGEFGHAYKAYLVRRKNFSLQHVNRCMRWISRLLYIAVDNGTIRVNPIEDMDYERRPDARHRYITRDELRRILATPMHDVRQELGRRAFIFSCFTGLAYADVQLLYPHHIGTTSDGRRYIRINRRKTKVEAFIPLHPIAERILSLYNTTDDEKPVFPLPSRDAMWFEIHELGVAIGKDDNLSYYQARHSFGTMLISESIPIESIAGMMGHSNISTTQGYAKITEDKIAREMDRLIKRRKSGTAYEKKE